MPVNPVNASPVQYVQTFEPISVKEYPDRYVYTYEESGTTGKKIGVGAASYFVPGLGQGINGQWGKAAVFFAGIMGGRVAFRSLVLNPITKDMLELYKNAADGKEKLDTFITPIKKRAIGMTIGSLLLTGATIWAIVDAVKNAKSKNDVVVMKEKAQLQESKQEQVNNASA